MGTDVNAETQNAGEPGDASQKQSAAGQVADALANGLGDAAFEIIFNSAAHGLKLTGQAACDVLASLCDGA